MNLSEDAIARLIGVVILAFMLWVMLAIPYIFVYVLPQPLQVWAGCTVVISAVVFTLDWLVARRNG